MLSGNSVEENCLDLALIRSGWSRLTKTMSQMFAEAASFLLERQGHKIAEAGGEMIPVNLSVNGDRTVVCCLTALPVDDAMRRTYLDIPEATEWGACAIAIMVIAKFTPYVVAKRSSKGNGEDYYLCKKDSQLFQDAARLEVSGTVKRPHFYGRIKQKHKQICAFDSGSVPAFVVVADFSKPTPRCYMKRHVMEDK